MARMARTNADSVPAIGVLKDTEKFTATAAFVDAQGASVPLSAFSSAPVWASSDASKVSVVAAADGGTAEIDGLLPTDLNADGSPATVAVTCTATNADGTTAVITGAVQVLTSDATTGGMVFGDPSTR